MVSQHKPEGRFYRRNGKLRFSGGCFALTAQKETILKVHSDVQTLFGSQVARQVCNRLFIPGYPPAPIFGVGSGLRADDLARCISLAGGDPSRLVVAPARVVKLVVA